ncbi:MAG TPA: type I polyketide synthase, partial [Herpetosiphonaceae bacterium]
MAQDPADRRLSSLGNQGTILPSEALPAANEPIALIGIGCRFPGGANDPEQFWSLLREGIDAISEVPADRWSIERFYDPKLTKPATAATKWGGFIDQRIELFDALFFGMSPREAAHLDPMQRWLLEVTWEALEDSGQVPDLLAGSRTGVFIGAFTEDNKLFRLNQQNRSIIESHTGTGLAMTMVANRISYLFDFRGPSVALDTACSSSLVAVHLACQSIWSGESSLALAGGVNAMFMPDYTIAESKAGMLSPDGRCKTFDARANGYVRGEGAGVVVLKPLSRALADGDSIYAVIRGSAVNQDGRTNGITVPHGAAQEALVKEACARAGVDPGLIQYVEAHGTGTPVGDPIEARALGAALSVNRPADRPCVMGSVKTNIGHLEAAAGIAGLIKAALCLKHRQIPPHLHLQELNPAIDLQALGLRIPQALEPWPASDGPLLACVNSFGFGGTNAHVVLEAAPAVVQEPAEQPAERATLVPLSARSFDALQSLARALRDLLDHAPPTVSLHDLSYTAGVRRTQHDYRLALVARSRAELIEQIEGYLASTPYAGTASGRKTPHHSPKMTFVFGGMGPQWWAMGRELLAQEPVFRAAVARCDELLRCYTSWSLMEELLADEANSRMGETQIAQPANFALQVALVELWRSWGVQPAAIVGHSAGEVAAAYAAGVMSLEDAVKVIYHRSRLQQQTTGLGKLAAVGLSLAEAQAALTGYAERVSIAAVNSPTSVTLVGDPEALAAVLAPIQEQEIFCRYLNVDVPYHSHYMEPLQAELLDVLSDLDLRPAAVPLFSTVTGGQVDGREFDQLYWWRNVREPVFFARAIDALSAAGYDLFLEIGPHPVLANSIKECLGLFGAPGTILPSLRRKADERTTMLESLGVLYALGGDIDFAALHPHGGRLVPLPLSPWQRAAHWHEADESIADRLGQRDHPLLGFPVPAVHPIWETRLDLDQLPYLDDHRLQGAVVYPGAAYVEASLAACRQIAADGERIELEQIAFHKALFVSPETYPTLHLVANQQAGTVELYSRLPEQGQTWTLHMSARLRSQLGGAGQPVLPIEQLRAASEHHLSSAECYAYFRSLGLEYGPTFQGIRRLWCGAEATIAEVELHPAIQADRSAYGLHPVILDLCFQSLLATTMPDPGADPEAGSQVYMPVVVERLWINGPLPERLWIHARLVERNRRGISGELHLCDEHGRVVMAALGVRAQALGDATGDTGRSVGDTLYQLDWLPQALSADAEVLAAPSSWLIFADRQGLGAALAQELERRGATSVLVVPDETYHFDPDRRSCRLNPADNEHFDRLLATLSVERLPIRGIVQLWGLDAAADHALTVPDLEQAQLYGCIATLHLLQALDRAGWSEQPRLWLVTRGTQAVGETDDVTLAQAPLWGMARVIAYEHRSVWGGIIDLDSTPAADEPALLANELARSSGSDQIALREHGRFVAQLTRAGGGASSVPLKLRADGSYLITGGLGGLGLVVARWLAEHGARRLILMGRTQLPGRAMWRQIDAESPIGHQVAAIRELESLGVTVHLAAVDVGDPVQLAAFLQEFQQEGWPAIRGVIHAAGMLRDRTILQLDAETFHQVLRPKIAGAWLLHTLLKDAPLDFFVLFSSVASLLGSVSQGNYAAANAFLDALAHHRRARGLPALSINWGPWAEIGMAARLFEQGGRLGV